MKRAKGAKDTYDAQATTQAALEAQAKTALDKLKVDIQELEDGLKSDKIPPNLKKVLQEKLDPLKKLHGEWETKVTKGNVELGLMSSKKNFYQSLIRNRSSISFITRIRRGNSAYSLMAAAILAQKNLMKKQVPRKSLVLRA
jgi:hypothetical protein